MSDVGFFLVEEVEDVLSAHVDRSGFFGAWLFEDTTPMSTADVVLVASCVYAGGA